MAQLDLGQPGDQRFFRRAGPHRLSSIAAAIGAPVPACNDVDLVGIAPIQSAGPDQLSFIDNRRYLPLLAETRAGAVIVHPELGDRVPITSAALITAEPYAAWAKAAGLFHPPAPLTPGVHESAVVDASAMIAASAQLGPHAVIGAGATIGEHVGIGAGAVIGDGVSIGDHSHVGALSVISHAIIGKRVVLAPGVSIGQEGFGFAQTATGFLTVPQLGRVIIEDDVQIGANSTVDRGSAQDTRIGAGSRLDNLVQIGHNVTLGRCCIIVAQVGIAGSCVLEDFVVVAGQAGMVGHIRIGKGSRIGAQSGVTADLKPGSVVVGSPAWPARETLRAFAALRRLAARGGRADRVVTKDMG